MMVYNRVNPVYAPMHACADACKLVHARGRAYLGILPVGDAWWNLPVGLVLLRHWAWRRVHDGHRWRAWAARDLSVPELWRLQWVHWQILHLDDALPCARRVACSLRAGCVLDVLWAARLAGERGRVGNRDLVVDHQVESSSSFLGGLFHRLLIGTLKRLRSIRDITQ
eukprot:365032-Chlamydomonas_euryale.AAC.19